MAKLSARGRTEYLRVRKGDQLAAFMSDGTVLYNRRDRASGELLGWKVGGAWDRVRTSLPQLRANVVAKGWEIVSGDGPRAADLGPVLIVLESRAAVRAEVRKRLAPLFGGAR